MTLKELLQKYAGVTSEKEEKDAKPKKKKVVRIKRKLKVKKGEAKTS